MVLACAKPAVIVPLTSVRFTAHLIFIFSVAGDDAPRAVFPWVMVLLYPV